MNDSQSFELVKAKWETELKKNLSKKYDFILLGLKSDATEHIGSTEETELSANNVSEELELDATESSTTSVPQKIMSGLKKSNTFAHHRRKRSCSINSNSSTSKFEMKTQLSAASESDLNAQMLSSKVYKNFAKQIGAGNFFFLKIKILQSYGVIKLKTKK